MQHQERIWDTLFVSRLEADWTAAMGELVMALSFAMARKWPDPAVAQHAIAGLASLLAEGVRRELGDRDDSTDMVH